jgi:hypothetical protein
MYVRPSGHLVVHTTAKRVRYVHQLVLEAFVGVRPKGFVTLHINHVPGDNRLTNIRYGTVSENIRADLHAGRRQYLASGDKHIATKLTARVVKFVRQSSIDPASLAEVFGVTTHHIRAIRRNAARQQLTNCQLKEIPMARTKTPALSKAEIKAKTAELKEARKIVVTEHSKFVADHKAAEKTLAVAKKDAEKAVAAAQKVVDAAEKKLAKASVAKDKGLAKIDAQINELAPADAPV